MLETHRSCLRQGRKCTAHFLLSALPQAVYFTDRYHSTLHSCYFPLIPGRYSAACPFLNGSDSIGQDLYNNNNLFAVSTDLLINKNALLHTCGHTPESTQPHTRAHTLDLYPAQVKMPAPFLPHLFPTLPFAPLIIHRSLILCLFYISIHRLLLLALTGE